MENNGSVLGVFILFLNRWNGGERFDGCDRPALFAINPEVSARDAKTVHKRVRQHLEAVLEKFSGIQLLYLETFPGATLSQPGLFLLERGAKMTSSLTCRIDLSCDLADLAADVRKSYKSLLNWGRKNLDIKLTDCTTITMEDVESFRQLHISVAGRETRSHLSWQRQYEMIKNNEAFMVSSMHENRLVSMSFYSYNRQHCYYGVSASIRELFDLPISHAPMWRAIEYAKEKGCRWFETGDQLFSGSGECNQKLLDISKFKRGFGGAIFPQMILQLLSEKT